VKFDEEMSLAMFDMIMEIAFGMEFHALEDPSSDARQFLNVMEEYLPEMLNQALDPLRKFKNIPEAKKHPSNAKKIYEGANKYYNEAKSSVQGNSGGKGLSEIINNIEGITHDERVANFFIFVVAGHDTTAHGLSFTLYNLLKHPDAMEACIKEVDSVVAGNQRAPDFGQLSKLTFLTQCLKESWRLYSPGTGSGRELTETKTIDGITLEKGTMISCYAMALNHNPRVWSDPYSFKPERWTREEELLRPKASFFTFSQGPRDCIGKSMALNESIQILAALLKRYTWSLDPGYKFAYDAGFTNKPKYDLLVHAKLRE